MKTLITTVCNDSFANALTLLMWSIIHHNPRFDHPLKIYHRGDLSISSQERILAVYPNSIFENACSEGYEGKIPHYLALEVFREYEPNRVVFIDSDIICTGDISVLCELDAPISACLDYDFRFPFFWNARFPFCRIARINTGVFVLNRTHRNPETYKALYSLLDRFPDGYVKGMPWSDQGIMNLYFKNDQKQIIPYHYNGRKNLFPNSRLKGDREKALDGVRLLHYGGAFKPFHGGLKHAPPNSKHHKYSMFHEVYYEYWNKMIQDLEVDWELDSSQDT